LHHLVLSFHVPCFSFLFLFIDPAPTQIYTLSLHDALPICSTSAPSATTAPSRSRRSAPACGATRAIRCGRGRSCSAANSIGGRGDRKSTRLNSSHQIISYAVFCLKKKNKTSTQ